MISVSLLFHANILYAEFSFSRIPFLVENSYIPVIKALETVPGIKAVFNFSGFTLEVLAGEHPEIYKGNTEVLDLIKKGIAEHRIELAGTSYAHAVLPLLPLWLQVEDIRLFKSTAERLLGYTPQGFFPPELGTSPILPDILSEQGYTWSFLDRDLVELSGKGFLNEANEFDRFPRVFTKITAEASKGNPFDAFLFLQSLDTLLYKQHDYSPLLWQGAGETSLWGFQLETVWITYTLLCLSRNLLFREKHLLKRIQRTLKKKDMTPYSLFFPYSADVEFYGAGGNTIKRAIPVSRLVSFLQHLSVSQSFRCTLPTDLCKNMEADLKEQGNPHIPTSVYVKAGSWSSDKSFELWRRDPDNVILEKISTEAASAFREKEAGMQLSTRNRILKDLLLAYNSDGRGWTPHPEHRRFCYNKARKVLQELS
ncbi:MAG: hypothetical protein JW904_05915 [Spirochaetales bacterium]|nr:hypothetical protein [Spirochaetales bacterium]